MSAAQQGEHGEHATVHVRGGLQAELAGDTGIGATLGHQGKDVSFAWGEVSERGVGSPGASVPGYPPEVRIRTAA